MGRTAPGLRHAVLLLPLVLVTAWLVGRGGETLDDPAVVLAALRAAGGPTLPTTAAVEATSASPLETFDRETLYEYIDGAADAYLARGFERCAVRDYVFELPTGDRIEITAEVYRFTDATGAAEQLAAERPAAARPVSGLDGAVSDGNVLLALRDRDLVKLVALTPGGEAADALERIARGLP